MADIKTFHLPDLGEGLPDATIVEWLVKEGATVRLDDPLVSMETAKAVVEVPSPYSGKLVKMHGGNGDVIITGAALAEFELDPKLPQRAEAQSTGHHHAPAGASAGAGSKAAHNGDKVVASDVGGELSSGDAKPTGGDAGTVVGAMQSSDAVHAEQAVSVGGVKAVPAVRALARKLGVDLARVAPSGAGGVVTMNDVKLAAASGSATAAAAAERGWRAAPGEGSASTQRAATPEPSSALRAPSPEGRREDQRTALSAAGKPVRTSPPAAHAVLGQPEQLKGMRRTMARVMAEAHAQIVATSIVDDADLHAWQPGNDITVRLLRALVTACKTVPALNAWFDGQNLTRTLHPHVDIGLAVDTEDGLFVPALRNADRLDAAGLRAAVNRARAEVMDRSIAPSELTGYTIMLSNFGMFAGRYATPVVVPPCVAILGAGKLHHATVPVLGGFEAHRVMPLSLTFDHRAATGGEAARFLKAVIDDLALPR
ncbi:dihydrolipoamide acetyltransferase family protein, partial [Metallibacterium sp.]|uniref:dihydrolipoamide acetyltransferase family protein n=1 Tax=Metallibacterium sp. TaxID=2940281 RepID=UPI002632FB3B